jgi:ATP-dependent helicase HrpA
MNRYQQVRKRLAETTQINWIASISDIQQQLDRLVYKGFLQQTPVDKLTELPRYLQAMQMRLEKLKHAAARDQQRLREMAESYGTWQEWDQRCRENNRIDERIEEMRWHFEELRVSLFVQELGTSYPISLKRIEKRWRELGL